MKLKTIILVTAVLVVLAIVTSWWGGRPVAESSPDPLVGEPLITADALRDLGALEISGDDQEPVRVELDDAGHWVVASAGGVPADVERLRRVAGTLAEARIARFVTARPERKEGLFMGDRRITLENAEGEELLDFEMGRTAAAGGVYIELGDEGRAYRLDQMPSVQMGNDAWIDRTPMEIEAADVQSVKVTFPDNTQTEPVTFSRENADGDWTISGSGEGATARGSEVDRIVRNLVTLRTNKHVAKDDPAVVEAAEYRREILMTTFAGGTIRLEFGRRPAGVESGEKAEPELAAEGSGESDGAEPEPRPAGTPYVWIDFGTTEAAWAAKAQDYAFEISEWVFNQMPDNPVPLIAPPPPPPPPPSGQRPPPPSTIPTPPPAPANSGPDASITITPEDVEKAGAPPPPPAD